MQSIREANPFKALRRVMLLSLMAVAVACGDEGDGDRQGSGGAAWRAIVAPVTREQGSVNVGDVSSGHAMTKLAGDR